MAERLARPRGAGGCDHHDVLGLQQSGCESRGQRQAHRRRIAAGGGDPLDTYEFFPLLSAVYVREFGETVGPRPRVVCPIELLPDGRIHEPVVRCDVDHQDVVAQIGSDRRARTMR